MFSPSLIQSAGESSLFRTRRRTDRVEISESVNEVNLREWSRYFNGVVSDDLLSDMLYEMPRTEIETIRSSFTQGRQPPDGALAIYFNALSRHGNRNEVLAALEYLDFAKRVEPLALRDKSEGWTYPPRPRPEVNLNVLEMLAEAADRVTRNREFIADRYRFQAMRLLFYSERYTEAQQYYERFGGSFTAETSVKYRFTELAAGAYRREKKYGTANYLYSVVFDRFAPLKASSSLSFHPMEEKDWKETLDLAKNTREKTVLLQLLGIYADGSAAIDGIYALEPQSKLLPLLLAREVNLAEENWTSAQFFPRLTANPGNIQVPGREVVGAKRIDRIRRIADEGKAEKPYLWLLGAGHLLAMSGDVAQAEAYLGRALKAMPSDALMARDQARASLILARVRSLKAIDKKLESFLSTELPWLAEFAAANNEAKNLENWLLAHLSDVYRLGRDSIRSQMLKDGWVEFYISASNIDRTLALMRAPKSPFDRFLLRNFHHTIEDLQQVRGLHYLYTGEFAKALDILKNGSSEALQVDPFGIRINDCLYCDYGNPRGTYTRPQFVERMLSLSRMAQGKGQAAADASFELANGFYNMSYYGNSRDIYQREVGMRIGIYTPKSNSNPALNMDRAEKYYVQAANLSQDREFKTKALFMASKAEQNRSYNSGGKGHIAGPGPYFQRLRDSFSDTQYYQEIIRECGYFRSFVSKP